MFFSNVRERSGRIPIATPKCSQGDRHANDEDRDRRSNDTALRLAGIDAGRGRDDDGGSWPAASALRVICEHNSSLRNGLDRNATDAATPSEGQSEHSPRARPKK